MTKQRTLKNARDLITGGAGFIGSNLCDHFIKNYKVVCLDNLATGFKSNLDEVINHPDFPRWCGFVIRTPA